MSRPELQAPPEIYYGDTEAEKYTNNTRIQQIQADMTYRALELLNLPQDEPAFLLDIGCGSGLSGEILDEAGYLWAGVDIAPSMLEVALEREVEGDLFLQDIGQGFGFRPGSFDGAISISVLQWLLNAETSHRPPLRNPSRAVLQFYPTSDDQVQLITSIAQRAGFGGGVVVDYPNSKKARKVFLCLFVGEGAQRGTRAKFEMRRQRESRRERSGKQKAVKGGRDWILRKKDLYRRRGKEDVPHDSKYTGRKRRAIF
ncbi:williams-Beuren syndrome critical region protein 22 [Russula vinacea]|nr:williams-Beuren syndrome critical region protein 22 [Russula vinacea]